MEIINRCLFLNYNLIIAASTRFFLNSTLSRTIANGIKLMECFSLEKIHAIFSRGLARSFFKEYINPEVRIWNFDLVKAALAGCVRVIYHSLSF